MICIYTGPGTVGLLRQLPPLRYFSSFYELQNTCFMLNITFIFNRCHRNLAAVTSVKHECDSENLAGTFVRSKNSLTVPSHNSNQFWLVTNNTNSHQLNFSLNSNIFLWRYAELNVVCQTSPILFGPQWVNWHRTYTACRDDEGSEPYQYCDKWFEKIQLWRCKLFDSLKLEIRFCRRRWYPRLSYQQHPVQRVTTRLASWQLCCYEVLLSQKWKIY